MRGFIEHDGKACLLGEHSNRTTTSEMCPVFLELRRTRLRNLMRERRFLARTGLGAR
jgi:hypothetical protein